MSRPLIVAAIGLSCIAGTALGDDSYTHGELLARALGGTFNASGLDFSNGSINAVRNKDFGSLASTDQVWKAGNYRARLVAGEEYGRVSSFGYLDRAHSNGRPFVSVFDADDIGARSLLSMDHQFRWAIQRTDGEVYTSLASDQHGRDMMVSYSLFDARGKSIGSMLFFEDRLLTHNKDYNDVAVLLTLVPTPQAATLGLLGLGSMGVLAGRRRREAAA